jgi:threonine dehydratase
LIKTVTLVDIQAARGRIASHVVQTPATRDESLGQELGAEIWFKWENHQTTGAFKLRGALNKILPLTPDGAPAGVVTASAGNHGLGVAYAARLRRLPATVYVPDTAPHKKRRGLAELGAQVVTVSGGYGEAEDAALAAARDSGAVWVSAYNDVDVIAGQGTLALEWLAQVPALDLLLVPVGGGGLVSGVGVAVKAIKPQVRVVGVQAMASAALHAAFYGQDMGAVTHRPTLADGLAGRIDAHSITVPLLKQVVDDVLLLSEAEIERAVAYAYRVHGEVIEGAAAVGLAALLAGKISYAECVVGVLVTGGNIDPERHAEILKRET